MTEKLYKNKYRIDSARLKGYDYCRNGLYFVTICAKNRELFFGDVVNKKMVLNNIGKLADKYWREIPQHFINTRLDEFIIMPNHIHGIIIINRMRAGNNKNRNISDVRGNISDVRGNISDVRGNISDVRGNISDVRGRDVALQRLYGGEYPRMSKISPKPKSLSAMIRSYKSIVTRESKIINPEFAWQTRFYDHIIRNEESLDGIRQYIKNNPEKWETDRNLPAGKAGNQENLWM